MIQLNADPGAYRVVDERDLFDLTSRGWRLIAVLDKQEVKEVDEPMPAEFQPQGMAQNYVRCNNCNGYGDPWRKWKKPHLVSAQRFLVHQVKDDLLTDLHAEIKKLAIEVEGGDERIKVMAKDHEQAGKVLVEKVDELAKTRAALNLAESREHVTAASKQKLEGDIAKLRQAIGDLRMKEILEGKA